MKQFFFRLTLALILGLSLVLTLFGFMDLLSQNLPLARAADLTVCQIGPPTCTYTNVQAAVDAAVPGDVIKVAGGTYSGVYTHSVIPFGGNPRVFTQMVYISKSLTIRGGYTPAFTEPSNPQVIPTILDAQGQGRVVFIHGNNSTIEGLRLRGGDAESGGLLFENLPPTGGGVLIVSSDTSAVSGNTIIDNEAGYGGGVFLFSAYVILNGNIIASNTASELGGGAAVISSAVEMNNNRVISNTASYGGGLYTAYGDEISNNIFSANTANYGGGLYINSSTLTNNIVADNRVAIVGSGLYARGASRLLHNTIVQNSGGDGSGVYIPEDSGSPNRVSLTNTILVSQTVGISVAAGNTVTLESTLWNGNVADWAGAGTISTNNNYTGDPAFVNPAGGDYHLGPTSAAIDKGINAGVITDIDGEARPQDTAPDLGADEYRAAPFLAISKSGPFTATTGTPIIYTLTLTNSGSLTATNLIITDIIPVGATYLGGGTKVGNVVSWTVPSLAANGGVTQTTFVVTATQTITNSDYGVRAEGGYNAQGSSAVVTLVRGASQLKVFLPVILKR